MTKLVIVESPAKAKKIAQFLPKEYKVEACVGHVRDLPNTRKETPEAIRGKAWADLAVDVEHDFEPHYVLKPGKSKVVAELKRKLKDVEELYLATDEDREGESISWHLLELLKPTVPVRRMVFNEITKEAILEALANPRAIDQRLVDAQETRRILDRLYGYTLSPLLWQKIAGGLSAGRVQSVAVRLVVERERERRAFVRGSYWDLTALLATAAGATFEARLETLAGRRVATAKDFAKETGKVAEGAGVHLLSEDEAQGLARRLRPADWRVASVDEASRSARPDPPFTTASLQQEAGNRLNLAAGDTMRIAQRLYESGLITYHRTDSTNLSQEALAAARAHIEKRYGKEYLPAAPRAYETKAKGAQEAHEAIRPAGKAFVLPEGSGLAGKDLDLYTLVFRRTIASQMEDERSTTTTVVVAVADATFKATGKRVDFPGFRAAYPVAEPSAELPQVSKGERLECRNLAAEGHETKPPARFTEASLVAALEKDGIGRPSTYAAILENIEDKGYVAAKGKALVPSFTAFAVVGFLEKNFPSLVDVGFTARMEEALDEIAAGEAQPVPYLREFYSGRDGLAAQVAARKDAIDPAEARRIDLPGLPGTIRIGRYGPYIEMMSGGERVSASLPEGLPPGDLDEATVRQLLAQAQHGPPSLGKDPASGKDVFLMTGRFGPYVQLGEAEGKEKPHRASIPRGWEPAALGLDDALFLLSLPRLLGAHPAGGEVLASHGRFGPYVMWASGEEKEFRSLAAEDDLRTVTLERGLALLSMPKGGRSGARRGAPKVLKDLGPHPADGGPVAVLEGRYGPYVKHADVNATLPKGKDPASVTMEEAVALIEARKERPARPRRRRKSG